MINSQMKRIYLIIIFLIVELGIIIAQTNKGLVFQLSGKGSITDISGNQVKIQGKILQRVPDHAGVEGKGIEFDYSTNKRTHFLKTNLDISSSHYPVMTITLWAKPSNTHASAVITSQGGDRKGRGLGILREHGFPCWVAFRGDKGPLIGSKVAAQWYFLALIYNQDAEKVWLIVNDEIFTGKTSLSSFTPNKDNTLTIGQFEGQISDLRVYDRMLTLGELNELSGLPIKASEDVLSFKIRRDFKKERRESALRKLDSFPLRKVFVREFAVYDTAEGKNIITYLHRGDTIRLISRSSDYGIFEFNGNMKGRNSLTSLIRKTFPAGESLFYAFLIHGLQNGVDLSSWHFWVVVLLLGIGLFFVFKYFQQIDEFFLNRRSQKILETARKGARNEYHSPSSSFFKSIFPIRRYSRWTFLIGFIAASTLFIGSLFNASELEWFLNGGFTFTPGEDYHGFTWFLWAMTILVIFLTTLMIVESFVAAGFIWGTFRILFILLVNLIFTLVALFAAIAVIIIVAAILGLLFFSSVLRSSFNQRYRCTRCGTIFTGDSCPNCS